MWSLGLILLFAACVPAEVPPVLSATAGSAVMVTGRSLRERSFSLTYPTGWRVITSPADAPPSVTLVAPGDCALIVVARRAGRSADSAGKPVKRRTS